MDLLDGMVWTVVAAHHYRDTIAETERKSEESNVESIVDPLQALVVVVVLAPSPL